MSLAGHPKAKTVLRELEDAPKDKYELADAIDTTPSTAKDKITILRDNGYEIRWNREEGKYHCGSDITVTAEEIAVDELLPELKDGSTVQSLCESFNTTQTHLYELFSELESQGYNIQTKDTPEGKIKYLPSEIDKRFSVPNVDSHFRFGLISDTHLGSQAEHLNELEEFYDRCVDRGVERIFHCGDISDGWQVHTGHLNEIKDAAAGWGRLKEYVIQNYPQRDSITTHFIEGNHDNKFYNRNNIRFGRLLGRRREDLHYCGNAQATFQLSGDVNLELIHPSGGKPYTTGYRLQTLYRERNPTERPSIAGVGHLHGSMYAETEGVKGFYAGAWKGTTTYGKRKGHEAKIGGWIVDVDIRDNTITSLTPQWHGWDERETANRYDVKDL